MEDYLALSSVQRSKTLIVANTNAERQAITQGIRQGLQAEGRLAADTFRMTSLKPQGWTTAEAKYARRYEVGNVIVPTQDYRKQQLVKGQPYTVVAIDELANRLTVEATTGPRFELDPSHCEQKTVYQTELIPLAPGDQMRWTRNDRASNRRNGQEFTIEGLDDRGTAIVRNIDGKTTFIDLSGQQFADAAIVSTTYASQGKTADRVLAALDGTTSKESFYVATSRAKQELALYTTDAAELRRLAARSRANENASDYLDLFTCENSHAQNQTRTVKTPTRPTDVATASDGTNRGVSVGSRAGERLAATLQRDCRAETSASDLDRSLERLSRSSPLAGIEAGRVCHAVAGFVERRTLCRNGAAITDAVESIAAHIQELERVSQELAERDRATETRTVMPPVSASVTDAINSEPPPARSPLTLADAMQLTQADWLELSPRQQLSFVAAARRHQSSEPGGYTQAEQWVGQRTQLQRQVFEAEARERVAAATLREIKAAGERSLFNPFGVTQSERLAARTEFSEATSARKRLAADLKEIDDRQAQRDQQDARRQEWRRTPQTQSAQHVLGLIKQPELKAQFQAVEQLYQQLQQWCDLAQSSQTKTKLGAKEIVAVASAYLDGQGLPMQTRQQMQQDLTQAQRQNHGRGRGPSR